MENEKEGPLGISKQVEKELNKYLDQFMPTWKECEDLYYGDIWLNGEYRPFENDLYKLIEHEVPILTDSVSGIVANVEDPNYIEQAKNLSGAIKWVLNNQHFPIKKQQVVRNSLKSAPGYIYVDYDYSAGDGDGENKLEVIPYYQVRLDGAVSYLEDSSKNQIDLYRRKSWLKKRYPKFAEKIDKMKAKEDEKDQNAQRGRETQDTGQRARRRRPKRLCAADILKLQITYIEDTTLVPVDPEKTAKEIKEENMEIMEGEGAEVNVYQNHDEHIPGHEELIAQLKAQLGVPPEASYEDVEEMLEQIIEDNPEADYNEIMVSLKVAMNHVEEHKILQKENPRGGEPKYPGGWRVIETIQELVVYEGPSRYKHNEFPVVPWYCYKDDTIYGFGEIVNLIDSQRMSAVMAYKEYKGLQKVANPSAVVYKDSGMTKDDVTNEDGAVYEVAEGGTAPQYLMPGMVSNQVGNFTEKRSLKMEDLSGINEASQGRMPSPNASGVTVQRVETQAIGRMRLKDRNNEYYSMKRLGKLIASNIIQFWSTEKVLKIEKEGGDYKQIIFNPLEMEDLKYEIDIAPGSMAGVDKDSFNGMLMQFLGAGQITLPQFLEVAEIPKSEKLKELISDEQQKAEQMQSLQMENLQLKAQFAPEQLTPEEVQLLQQSGMEGLNSEQPVA